LIPFVEAVKSRYPVTRLYRMAEVSRAASYTGRKELASRQHGDAALGRIRAIHAASHRQ